jgi:hypothetical protein
MCNSLSLSSLPDFSELELASLRSPPSLLRLLLSPALDLGLSCLVLELLHAIELEEMMLKSNRRSRNSLISAARMLS